MLPWPKLAESHAGASHLQYWFSAWPVQPCSRFAARAQNHTHFTQTYVNHFLRVYHCTGLPMRSSSCRTGSVHNQAQPGNNPQHAERPVRQTSIMLLCFRLARALTEWLPGLRIAHAQQQPPRWQGPQLCRARR